MNVYGITWPPELLTKEEAARILSTSVRGVAELVARGHLTRVDDGGKRTKFRLSDVRAYVRNLPPRSDVDPPVDPPELLTREGAAYMLSISTRLVGDLIRAGHLRVVVINLDGKPPTTRIRLVDLRAYVAALAP